MLAEMIDRFEKLVNRTREVAVIHPSSEPVHRYLLHNRTTGEFEWRTAQPDPINHSFYTLEDLVAFLHDTQHSGDSSYEVVVFCGRGEICAVLDNPSPRRERVTVVMPESLEFQTLIKAAGCREPLDQKAFLRLLRVDLATCVADEVVAEFRSLQLKSQTDAKSEVSTSRETVGKTIKREMLANGKEIRDLIELSVHVYRDLAIEETRRMIQCVVDTDLDAGTFTLIPRCGELDRAQRTTDDYIKSTLEAELADVAKVYCGAV